MTVKRAAIYARFSSEKQNDRSIDDQVALCRALCDREGLSVVSVYDDRAISGASTANRMGWLKLMHEANKGKFDVVVAEALDRISRDQEDLAGIYKRLRFQGIDLRTVQDGSVGELHVGVKGLLSALYLKDLAQKTRRGQAGVVREGRHNGGRSYGYRAIPGKNGCLEIVEHEAAIIRRIFDAYVRGNSPRDIAAALNGEGIPGPRGGFWNASTIGGSRKRANGILQNALYVGRIVWNRQSFVKDPDTGRRISRPNPEAEWMTSEARELRIISDELFEKAQKRKAQRAGPERHQRVRSKRLLSGLIKCGCCGSGYRVSGADKRGHYLRCSRIVETGQCDNHCTVGVDGLERRVLAGIEKQLASPDLIAEYIREYHRAWTKLRDGTAIRRAQLERELHQIKADTKMTVELLMREGRKGQGVMKKCDALMTNLEDLEDRQKAIEAELAEIVPPLVELHPNVGDIYRKKVKDLKAYLAAADEDNRADAFRAIRELIEKVVIRPKGGPYKGFDIELHGQLAVLLEASKQGTIREPTSKGAMVAGVGFEPTTFRL